MKARWLLIFLALVWIGCDAPGPETFATFMLNGQSETFTPASFSRAGDEAYVEGPGLKIVSGKSGVSGQITLQGKAYKIVRGSLTLQSLKNHVAQGNLELVLDAQPPLEVRGSFKARSSP